MTFYQPPAQFHQSNEVSVIVKSTNQKRRSDFQSGIVFS